MKKPLLAAGALLILLATFWLARTSESQADGDLLPTVTMYSTPYCGCCVRWVEYLEQEGFQVETVLQDDVGPVKDDLHVPRQLHSCHTAVVDGYAVEGHVPARAIRKMLRERPDIAGIAVPGMPAGAPGMESANPVSYNVISFGPDEQPTVFEHIPAGSR